MGITGTLGNVMVCTVIARNLSMRTSTNFFLFSLAVADIAILIMGASFDLSVYWQQYPWVLGELACRVRAFLSEMTSYCSVLTILSFSFERYLAICHPLYLYTMSGTKRTTRLILLLWLVSGLAAAPFAYFTKINYWGDPFSGAPVAQSAFCGMLDIPEMLYELSSLVFFLVPMVALVVLYFRMGLKIRQTGGQRVVQDGAREKTKKVMLKMLAVVVVSFFVCWAPFHTQRLLYVAQFKHRWNVISEELYYSINEKLFYVAGMFLYLNSTINPIIYNLISAKYRKAFKETLLKSCFSKARAYEKSMVRAEDSCFSRITTDRRKQENSVSLDMKSLKVQQPGMFLKDKEVNRNSSIISFEACKM
eukprot:TRINITY_DN33669_c0_g1_i1.p1 TRINITY_DN33669_c0_g1~~TRINITY_DN33669_c0_g1_i1.p1  ORF type:complete len:422 (+),score=119.18 TRINITY_DN33669_c0_g1_i1:180-1268(+)